MAPRHGTDGASETQVLAERLIWGFGDGSTVPVFDTPLGRLGAIICWENYMPLLRMAMYAKGIQLYCAPTCSLYTSTRGRSPSQWSHRR